MSEPSKPLSEEEIADRRAEMVDAFSAFDQDDSGTIASRDLGAAMRRLGHAIDVVPQPVNFFTHTVVEADGAFNSPPNPVPAGAYVELEALMDTICVVSACPFDLNLDGWTINSPERGPTGLEVEFLSA